VTRPRALTASDVLDIVALAPSITSSSDDGHAVTWRALIRQLRARGHSVLLLERDAAADAGRRCPSTPPTAELTRYRSLAELRARFSARVRDADAVLVGSSVPEGLAVGDWVLDTRRRVAAFYDIDTPVTLGRLEDGDGAYLAPAQVRRYDAYFSLTGGPILRQLERRWGARRALPLYPSADPDLYRPEPQAPRWDLGYLGAYSADRQSALERMLLEPARRRPDGRFVVVGPRYPDTVRWPANVERATHLAPPRHRSFYTAQRFALSVTRGPMVAAGWSPGVRLFEAAACGVPIISDPWPGLEAFLAPGREVLVSRSPDDTLRYLRDLDEPTRRAIGARARARVLESHTAAHRAATLEGHLLELCGRRPDTPAPAAQTTPQG
jgi:spore maturation protein CgeB